MIVYLIDVHNTQDTVRCDITADEGLWLKCSVTISDYLYHIHNAQLTLSIKNINNVVKKLPSSLSTLHVPLTCIFMYFLPE